MTLPSAPEVASHAVRGLYGKQKGSAQALVGQLVERGMMDGVVQRGDSFFLYHRDLEQFAHELGGQDATHARETLHWTPKFRCKR